MKIHSAFSGNGYGICGEPLRISPQLPQPRRRRDEVNNLFPDCAGTPGPSPGKHYLLDTRLLMGGTYAAGANSQVRVPGTVAMMF
jgi:hypothetical protein